MKKGLSITLCLAGLLGALVFFASGGAASAPATPQAEGTIAGTITAQDTGLPLANISVGVRADDHNGGDDISDSQGRFQVSVEAGQYRVSFYDPTELYLEQWYDQATSFESATPVTVSAGITTALDVELAQAGLIHGYVNMDGALPLGTKLWLDAYPGGDPTTSADWVALTGPGYYTLNNLASGEYKIRSSFVTYNSYVLNYANAYYDLQTTFSAGAAISVTQGLATEINLDLTQLGRICGSVSERFTGQPVPELFEILARNVEGEAMATTHTDANGSYCFWRLAPGTYYVVFSGLVWPATCPTACLPDQSYQEEGYFQAITLGRGAVVSGVNGSMAPYKMFMPVISQ